jgi:omega-6 fatty acid desaturase (delta-12 desaturase)
MAAASMKTSDTRPSLAQLRQTIPARCFQRSTLTSLSYVARDLTLVAAVATAACYIPSISLYWIRVLAWVAYGYIQGLLFTGVWIIAHECGHGALFDDSRLGDTIGFVLHSFLLVPYFSWKHSHAKHHRYANHLDKDTAFVPRREHEPSVSKWLHEALHLSEDTPLVTLILLIGHQILGWPIYLLMHATAGVNNFSAKADTAWSLESHFHPGSTMFSESQRMQILLSDLGLLAMGTLLWLAAQNFGWQILLLYGVPYLWVNHWIVAITFLHHNHPEAKHFEKTAWTFADGALNTVDRDFGLVGRKLFHGIIEFHVVHHLFP